MQWAQQSSFSDDQLLNGKRKDVDTIRVIPQLTKRRHVECRVIGHDENAIREHGVEKVKGVTCAPCRVKSAERNQHDDAAYRNAPPEDIKHCADQENSDQARRHVRVAL